MTSPSMIPVPVVDPLDTAWFECNDRGNALRFEALAGGLVKWVDDKFWVAFDGRRWSEREGQFRARMVAHAVSEHLNAEAAALGELIGDPEKPDREALDRRYPGGWCTPDRALERLKALRAWAVRSGNATQTTAMLTQAKDLPGMRAWSEEFDVDPLVYNVSNGTLRFRSHSRPPAAEGAGSANAAFGVMPGAGVSPGKEVARSGAWACYFQEGHEPGDMLRQMSNWTFDPAATCPQWIERFVLVQPDEETRAVFPRMYGQTLTGLTDSEEFYVHKGRGGDGKTKTNEIIAHGHGDYYRHAAVATWLQAAFRKSGAEHRRDLIDLAGDVRFILSDEPGRGATWDGELLKQWTGGGSITAFGAGDKQATVFKPRGKLFVEVNPTPNMPGDDKGFRRRFRLVQWLVDLNLIPGGFESPAAIRERLWAEQSGILNWLIAGCLDWLGDRKVPVPERESEALAEFWATGNPLGEWLEEECDLRDRDAETGSTALWKAFSAWMEKNEIEEDARKKWNPTRFGRELGQRQLVGKKDRRGNKVRRGIRLRGADPLLGGDHGSPAGQAPASPPKAAAPENLGWPEDDDGEDTLGG